MLLRPKSSGRRSLYNWTVILYFNILEVKELIYTVLYILKNFNHSYYCQYYHSYCYANYHDHDHEGLWALLQSLLLPPCCCFAPPFHPLKYYQKLPSE